MDEQATTRMQGEIDELRAELERLKADLSRARTNPGDSMREQLTCPKCKGRSILHMQRVRDYNYSNMHVPMAIQEQATGFFSKRTIGAFELYACRACEYAEWYVVGAGEVDPTELDKENRKLIHIIENEPPESGPFR